MGLQLLRSQSRGFIPFIFDPGKMEYVCCVDQQSLRQPGGPGATRKRGRMIERLKRYGVILLICGGILLLLNICCPYWFIGVPFLRTWYYEQLDEVVGEAELVVGAKYGIRYASVSPNGRWLMAQLNKAQPTRTLLVDLEERKLYRLDMDSGAIQWLDNHHVYSIFPPKIFRVPDMVWWKLEIRSTTRPDPNSLEELAGADHIYALSSGSSGLVTTDPDLPYEVGVNWDGEEVAANLADIPHTIFCNGACPLGIPPPGNLERYVSPDGRYYVETARHPDVRYHIKSGEPVIFDAWTGERVAHIYKWDWGLRSLGWAADSSGVYFELVQYAEILTKGWKPIRSTSC